MGKQSKGGEEAPIDRAAAKDAIVARPLQDVRRARGQDVVAVQRSKIAGLKAFRRMRTDRIVGAIGIVLLVAGAFLLFAWENPPDPQPAHPVAWAVDGRATDLNQTQGYLSEPRDPTPGEDPPVTTQEYSFSVDHPNATHVQVSFEFLDDIGNAEAPFGADTFNVTVSGPEGLGIQVMQERAGTLLAPFFINFTIGLNPTPALSVAPVWTAKEARDYVSQNLNVTTLGMGPWTVTVRMVEALDQVPGRASNNCQGTVSPTEPDGGVCTPDPGNSFTLSADYGTYRATFPAPE